MKTCFKIIHIFNSEMLDSPKSVNISYNANTFLLHEELLKNNVKSRFEEELAVEREASKAKLTRRLEENLVKVETIRQARNLAQQ